MSKKPKAKAATPEVRNRIVDHVRVRAGDLVANELNPRTHDDAQREALRALYEEVGFARSLLGYKVICQECKDQQGIKREPCGCNNTGYRVKLIDGHLRQSMDPDMQVSVEILDVTEEEARKLLLSIDPLAQLAGYDQATLTKLEESVRTENDTLANLWKSAGRAQAAAEATLDEAREKESKRRPKQGIPEQFVVIIQCDDETHQRDVLRWVKEQGLECKAVLS